MISDEDWAKLKSSEQYGMYIALEKRVKNLEDSIPWINTIKEMKK